MNIVLLGLLVVCGYTAIYLMTKHEQKLIIKELNKWEVSKKRK